MHNLRRLFYENSSTNDNGQQSQSIASFIHQSDVNNQKNSHISHEKFNFYQLEPQNTLPPLDIIPSLDIYPSLDIFPSLNIIQIKKNETFISTQNRELMKLTNELIDLNKIMFELNEMLGIQGEMLQKTELTVETTVINIEQPTVKPDVIEHTNNNRLIGKIVAIAMTTIGMIGTILIFII